MLQVKLNDTQRAELKQLARLAVGRICERIHFVLLSDKGLSPPQIANLFGYSQATVRFWLKSFEENSLSGLEDSARSGRPKTEPLLTQIVRNQAGQSPSNSGYLQVCWTVALLAMHLWSRFSIKVSQSTVRRTLRESGYVWSRPKHSPAKITDPLAEERLRYLNEILEAGEEVTILAEDECDMHLLSVVRAMWQKEGEQKEIPTPGKNAKRGVFGALNLRTGEWFYLLRDRKRSQEFIEFLKVLLEAYPRGPIFLIVDNAPIHRSKAVEKFLSENQRLKMVNLPTYSGHRLNPVEKVWWDLKAKIAANRNFKKVSELDDAIKRYFAELNQERALRLTNCEVVRRANKKAA